MKTNNSKILLLEGVNTSALEVFNNSGFTNVELLQNGLEGKELIEKLQGVEILGIRSRTMLTKEVLEAAVDLKAVGCFCIGTNQVDLETASKLGISVFNAPFSNTRSVAELVMGEIIMLSRGIFEKSTKAHSGDWLKTANNSFEVRGKILGIVGYGNIGKQLSVLAEGLGMNVIFFDPMPSLNIGNAKKKNSLEEVLKESDFVSLHVPDLESTRNLINDEMFSLMKDGSFLINASRGKVVDIDALKLNIENGKILGAAIDVFPKEPKSKNEKFESVLQGIDSVILTPHIGGSTIEAQINIGKEVSEKLSTFFLYGNTVGSCNLPELSLKQTQEFHKRVKHIHKNIPGMLAKINSIFGEANIQVYSQYLETKKDIGYVVFDVSDINEDILKELENIDGTIRVRVLS